MENDIRRVFSLYDIHSPENIDLATTEECMYDFKPTHRVYGGDQMHLACVRQYARKKATINVRDKDFNFALEELEKDFAVFNKILDRHDSLVPKNCETAYLIGNHDNWLYRIIEKIPALKKTFDPVINLRLNERKYKVIPEGRYYQVGKLYWIHGHYHTDIFTKKTVLAYRRNIMMGHTHTTQLYTTITPLFVGDRQTGRSIPCLCHTNPDYAWNRPNRWVNGFSIAYVLPTGNFNEYTIEITDGRFVWNDKIYGKKGGTKSI